jgi:hypothetical protein
MEGFSLFAIKDVEHRVTSSMSEGFSQVDKFAISRSDDGQANQELDDAHEIKMMIQAAKWHS